MPPALASNFSFLRLPPEIRMQIYECAIVDHFDDMKIPHTDVPVSSNSARIPFIMKQSQLWPPLLKVHNTLKEEASPLLFSRFPLFFADLSLLRQISAEHRALIRHAGVRIYCSWDAAPNSILAPSRYRPLQSKSRKKWAANMKRSYLTLLRLIPNVQKLELHLNVGRTNYQFHVDSDTGSKISDCLQPLTVIPTVNVWLYLDDYRGGNEASRIATEIRGYLKEGMYIDAWFWNTEDKYDNRRNAPDRGTIR